MTSSPRVFLNGLPEFSVGGSDAHHRAPGPRPPQGRIGGRRWLDQIVAGTVTSVEHIAAREKCSIRQVNMTISLAFLAPELVKAAVEGRLPRGIGVTRLRDAPAPLAQ
jgi:hypothetical protein